MIDASLPALLSVVAVFALILLNAAWVAAEFAIVRVRRTRLAELAGQGVERAKHAIVVVDGMSDYLAVTQIGVTVSSLAVGWLADDAFSRVFGSSAEQAGGLVRAAGVAAAFVIASALLIVLGELVPKLLAVRRAEHFLLVLARPLRIAHLVFRPVLRVLERASSWILRSLGHGGAENRPLTEDELKLVLAESHKGGVVSDREAEIIVRAFEFADKQSEEVMVPAERVAYLSLGRSLRENLDEARRHMHTRLPLCQGGLDTVIGTVCMKDAWPLLEAQPSNAAFERVCRPPIVVSVEFSQEDILKALQKGRGHMAIVRDPSGRKTLGIVTLEDVLDSLIGDVREAKLR
jgi:CBS domain containing-hemolysin-like protein